MKFVRLLVVLTGFAAIWTPSAHAEDAKDIERIAEQAYIWGNPQAKAGLIRGHFTPTTRRQDGETPPTIERLAGE